VKKTFHKKLVALGCVVFLVVSATSQTFKTLHLFTGYPNDGAEPSASLILSGSTLYGTTSVGGTDDNGTVFKVNTDGTGFTNIYSFSLMVSGTNGDGANPTANLILSGSTLYGTANGGGTDGNGTVFKFNTDGTVFTNLHSFIGYPSEGATPNCGLVLSGNMLYGTTTSGGSSDAGTVFAIKTNGSGFTNLYSFTGGNDGGFPTAGLILSGNTLYGTAVFGGSVNYGAVFAIKTNGSGFTNLYSFTGGDDGVYPNAGLILSGNTLYGTASRGSDFGYGSVFSFNIKSMMFTNVSPFTDGNGAPYLEGAYPLGGLILSGNTLYGSASGDDVRGYGTLFAIRTNGTSFTNIYNFTDGNDGANPSASLVLSGNTLYGTAVFGGSGANGTVFSLSFAPSLTITRSGTNVIVEWPTNLAGFNYTGFTLQSKTNIVSTTIWSTVSRKPVVVNGQDVVTNSISGTRRFFRLIQ
jgi:uncharacterized repeat protein (TIGR03803 family)